LEELIFERRRFLPRAAAAVIKDTNLMQQVSNSRKEQHNNVS
jgi:hypothetical protein